MPKDLCWIWNAANGETLEVGKTVVNILQASADGGIDRVDELIGFKSERFVRVFVLDTQPLNE